MKYIDDKYFFLDVKILMNNESLVNLEMQVLNEDNWNERYRLLEEYYCKHGNIDIPYFYTVSTDEMAHDDIYEIFHSIPNILLNDHDWQGPDSADGNRTRRERNPKYQ